ncbi:MAG: cytochrome c maturation protein CcmE [Methylotetracoccus sp.]|jgi:cytochrome c-type biogenesis protein CcmE|nr:cytochrome c maturation protein CcmE [Methylotetracoccus sp.]
MTRRQRQMFVVSGIVIGVSFAAFLALTAFQKNLLYFYTPTQIAAGEAPTGYAFRVGGLVVPGSVKRDPDSLNVHFDVTDGGATVAIAYFGILPDLFREGQGIISVGQLNAAGLFVASEVLAKHDENYMPPEVADSMKKDGHLPIDYKSWKK